MRHGLPTEKDAETPTLWDPDKMPLGLGFAPFFATKKDKSSPIVSLPRELPFGKLTWQ